MNHQAMKPPQKIVDSHQHINWHQRNTAAHVADMDAHGIAYAWLLSWCIDPLNDEPHYHRVFDPRNTLQDGTHPGLPLDDILAARERHPDRYVAGYCPNPYWKSAPAYLEAAHRMHDVRVCGEWKFRILFDDPRCLEIFGCAGDLELPVVLHLDVPYLPDAHGRPGYQPRWYGGTVDNLERALEACPKTTFIGHAPGFWREISGDANSASLQYPDTPVTEGGRLYPLFATYPNLWADLSAGSARTALSRDRKHAIRFLNQFADRLLFGRDYYGTELHEFLQSLSLDEGVIAKIYYKNAERLVKAP